MGNTFCKHRVGVDAAPSQPNGKLETTKTQSSIDKIIQRVQLCPRSLTKSSDEKNKQNKESKRNSTSAPIAPVHKSRSHHHRRSGATIEKTQSVATITPASSEWMDVALDAPASSPRDKRTATPVPPPRKHRKRLREKLESITKNVIGGLHGTAEERAPVVEPIITRTVVRRHVCDADEHRCANRRDDVEPPPPRPKVQHQKNHSTVSLPNYSELQLSVPKSPRRSASPSRNSSAVSLPGETKRPSTILETYMTRCRSFGSLLPHQILERLKSRRVAADAAESDDSWGGLEDWDLGVIEHYKPHESSLPRPTKTPADRTNFTIGGAGLTKQTPPVPPVRRSESLQKRLGGGRLSDGNNDDDFIDKFIENERSQGVFDARIVEAPPSKNVEPRSADETLDEAIDAFDRLDRSETETEDLARNDRTNRPDVESNDDEIQRLVDKLPKICDGIAKNEAGDACGDVDERKRAVASLKESRKEGRPVLGVGDASRRLRTPPPTPEVVGDEPETPALQMKSFDEIVETVNEHSGLMRIINVMARDVDAQRAPE